jgi:hypothetical protein
MDKFTLEKGLEYQKLDLSFWKIILKRQAYNCLKAHVGMQNLKLNRSSDGYDVFRGQDLTSYVLNMRNF